MTRFDGVPIIGKPRDQQTVEVCRSFSYKLNLGNCGGPQYESADFFASRKIQCAAEDAEWVSQQIYEECVAEVRTAVANFKVELRRKRASRPGEAA